MVEASLVTGHVPDLVTGLRYPLYIAHRGGSLRYPEHSIEAYRAAAAAGFPVEPDLGVLSDGAIVCIHDSTVDRTMTGTGAVSSFTSAQWQAMRVNQIGGPAGATGAARGQPTFFTDVLREFGGHYLLVPEIKNTAQRAAILAAIEARGLRRAVIVQSFVYADVQDAGGRGIAAMFLSDAVGTGGANPTAAQVFASGIEFLGCSTAASGAYISAAKAAGLKVIVYTTNTRAAAATAITTNGADGVFSDDPWHVTGNYLASDTDPWASKRWWPGSSFTLGPAGPVYFGVDMFGSEAIAAQQANFNHNWAGTRTGTGRVRVRARVHFLPSANTDLTRWVSVFIGQFGDDSTYSDVGAADEFGYHVLFRRNGAMDIYSRPAGAGATQIATVAGTTVAAASEGFWDVEITIDATNVTVKNVTTGVSATVANTTFRQAFKLASIVNATNAYLSRMSVADLP